MIKLIASDVDGTLLNGKSEIDDYTVSKIKEAMKQGTQFVIASGRAYGDLTWLLKQYDLKCSCITGNGAEYYDEKGEKISSFYLDYQACLESIAILKQFHIAFMIYCVEGNYSIEPVEKVQDVFIQRSVLKRNETYQKAKKRIQKNHSIFKMSEIKDYPTFLKDKHIIKIEAFDLQEDTITKAKNCLKSLSQIAYLSSFPDNVEITSSLATKGSILMDVISKLDIKQEEVMVIGDSYNDVSMFDLFSCSVAMGNSVDFIKEKAKYITDDYFHNGVGKAIEKIALQNT
mgnify:FL=1